MNLYYDIPHHIIPELNQNKKDEALMKLGEIIKLLDKEIECKCGFKGDASSWDFNKHIIGLICPKCKLIYTEKHENN